MKRRIIPFAVALLTSSLIPLFAVSLEESRSASLKLDRISLGEMIPGERITLTQSDVNSFLQYDYAGVIPEGIRNLRERAASPGTRLSGGEPQMLAIGRTLRTGAKLLLLDEISEGLAPVIVQMLGRVITSLKAKGFTIIMVEQNFRFAAPLADRHYVIEHGRIVETVTKDELDSKMQRLQKLLGV